MKSSRKRTSANDGSQKTGHVRFRRIALHNIKTAPENETLYRPIDPDDPEIKELAKSIGELGLLDKPIITADGYLVSGHRRTCACKVAGKKMIEVEVLPICREDDIDGFVRLLREHNRQRDKTREEKLREELVTIDPTEAYQALIQFRSERSQVGETAGRLRLNGRKVRSSISDAKRPFLDQVLSILDDLIEFWPLSLRTVHYKILNASPLRHASKPKSRYANDRKSYQDLSDLCTRARLTGEIEFDAIADETRPMRTWRIHPDAREFIRDECNGFLKNFWRDLMVSQPNHLEIVAEKNTIEPILRPVAAQYTIPITSGRGFASIPPRYKMAQRFEASGKDSLILIVVSDFDPSGESIAQSFAESMRDDFGIENITAIKAALTYEQVQELDLHTDFEAKRTDSRYKRFVEKYGTDVYELESVDPRTSQRLLKETIDSVIDTEAFNAELEAEQQDAAFLEGVRRQVFDALKGIV